LNRSSRAPLLIIFITVFIDLLGFGIVLPLLPRYAKHFNTSGPTLGLLMASFSAMQFLFAPIWGRISDRVGRRPILVLGLAGSAFFYAVFGYATSLGVDGQLLGLSVVPWLFICRIGAGIAGATIPTAQAYIADVTGPQERAKGMALIGAAFGIGFTFGPLLGACFLPSESTPELDNTENTTLSSTIATPAVADSSHAAPSSAPGYVASVLSGLALLSALFLLPESLKLDARLPERRWLEFETLNRVVENRAVGLVLLTMFLTTFAFGQFESTLSLLTRALGLPDRNNYFVFAYIGFILSLSQGLLVRRLVPRLGELVMCRIGTVFMTIGLLLIGFAGSSNSRGMLYSVLPVSVIGFSAVTPSLQSLLSRHTAASEQGGVLGLGQSISALARILGPMLGLTLTDLNIVWPYWAGAALMGFSILLTIGLRFPAVGPADGAPDDSIGQT
jgi:DHA1 family tetracycline resistance protein-like MFS transporter